MLPTRSTWRRTASPRNDSISWRSHWNRSVVSGVSGRIHAEPRRRIAPRRWSLRHTPTRCRVGVGGNVVRRVSQLTTGKVTLATSSVKRYTPTSFPGGGLDDHRHPGAAHTHPRPRALLPPPGPAGLRGARGPRGPDGARDGGRAEVAHEGRDARGHRGLPILARAAGHPGRHLDF